MAIFTTNNNTESTDAYTQSSASRYFDNGNVRYETTPMSAGENLVTNSSMETGPNAHGLAHEWNKVVQIGTSSDIFWSTRASPGFFSSIRLIRASPVFRTGK